MLNMNHLMLKINHLILNMKRLMFNMTRFMFEKEWLNSVMCDRSEIIQRGSGRS